MERIEAVWANCDLSPTDCTVPETHLRFDILSHTREVMCSALAAAAGMIDVERGKCCYAAAPPAAE